MNNTHLYITILPIVIDRYDMIELMDITSHNRQTWHDIIDGLVYNIVEGFNLGMTIHIGELCSYNVKIVTQIIKNIWTNKYVTK